MILYHKSNLVYTIVFPQFLIFQKNNSVQTLVLIFFTFRHYYFFEKLKLVEKQLCKLNCSYGKVSHTLKLITFKKLKNFQKRLKYFSNYIKLNFLFTKFWILSSAAFPSPYMRIPLRISSSLQLDITLLALDLVLKRNV